MNKDVKPMTMVDWLDTLEKEWDKLSPEEKAQRQAEAKAEQERFSKMSPTEIIQEMEHALAKSLGKPDWTYRDLPRMTRESLDNITRIIGEEEIYWITFADYGESVRGQILISPVGMEALRQYSSGIRQ